MNNGLPTGSTIAQCMEKCGGWGADFSQIFLTSSNARKCLEECMPAFFPEIEAAPEVPEAPAKPGIKIPSWSWILLIGLLIGGGVIWRKKKK